MPTKKGKVRVVFEPDGTRIFVHSGTTILAAATAAGITLNTPCGGNGTCGNCRVKITSGQTHSSDTECEILSGRDIAQGVRLACQARVESDLLVTIPQKTRAFEQKILVEGVATAVELSPHVRRVKLALSPPSIEDQRSDADRVLDAVAEARGQIGHCDITHLRRLPQMLRDCDFKISAIIAGDRVLGIERPDGPGVFGAAFDIGTTTVVGVLVDLESGQEAAVASRTNPQVAQGDDVVSRISYVSQGITQREESSRLIIDCVNDILSELAGQAGIDVRDIYEVTFAGNTTMNHLLLCVDPTHVAQAPYVAALRQGMELTAHDLGVAVSPHANLYTLPNIAGFVGGDTVGVILASNIAHQDEMRMAIDIGTNGEIVVGSRDGLACVSCAAGPAFEGARIEFGMRAAVGAIERIDVKDGNIRLAMIGNERPHGLCGSGLIDALARLIEIGLIDETGALAGDPTGLDIPDAIKERVRIVDGEPAFFLALPAEAATSAGVYLTQRDVREVQLAKGAIVAGTRTLLAEMKTELEDVAGIDVAGAFGNYIRAESARTVGILPDVPTERIRFIGNGAGAGARMVLLNAEVRKEAERISRETRYIELAGRSDFQTIFMEAMLFTPSQH